MEKLDIRRFTPDEVKAAILETKLQIVHNCYGINGIHCGCVLTLIAYNERRDRECSLEQIVELLEKGDQVDLLVLFGEKMNFVYANSFINGFDSRPISEHAIKANSIAATIGYADGVLVRKSLEESGIPVHSEVELQINQLFETKANLKCI
ncbi:hypothetical protein ACFYU8_17780 [Brevibacillus sp. NPDC003359]|uniref:hypothetical protein n=1 Tax=unclassified Brevibacillus TaxID=2684853 RepID=UPI0036CC3524